MSSLLRARKAHLADDRLHDLGAVRPDDSFGDVGRVRIRLYDAGAGRVQSPNSERDGDCE
jgi:hypothetical protein